MPAEIEVDAHPLDSLFRADRLPHIWCPGCGLGPVMACYGQAILDSGIPRDKHAVVSGIGCTGRVPGYVDIDSFHTTHGRPIPFATGMKIANPELEVTVVSGDGDLFAIGGNHFLHAARRNVGINIICVNNFNYGMTGGQGGPTTPMGARTSTTPYGCFEAPLNMPWLAYALGAEFVARWTALHVRQLKDAISRAMEKKGFTFIEVLAPCPIGFGRPNDLGEGLDEMHLYQEECIVNHDADLREATIDLRQKEPLILGNFVDIERTPFTTVPEQFRS
jgi:2-oxoglutarate ferredoxin oxidoreductase subunit beta